MHIVDGADLLAAPPQPITWAVHGILQMGAVSDIAGQSTQVNRPLTPFTSDPPAQPHSYHMSH